MSRLASAIVLVDLLAFGFVGPLLPLYVRALGGNARAAGLLVSAFSLTSLVSLPLLGRLADRIGRKAVIVISLAGNVITLLAFACAMHIGSLALLFASRVVAGALAGNVTTCQSVVADVSPPHEVTERMGHIGAAMGLGLVIGPAIGSALYAFGAWAPPLGAALVTALDLAVVVALLPETLPSRAPASPAPPAARAAIRRAPLSRSVIAVLSLHFLVFFCMSNLQAVLPLFLKARLDWRAREIGVLFGLSGLLTLVMQGGLIGPITRVLGARSMLAAGAALTAVAMASLGVAHAAFAVVASLGAIGVGLGLALPALSVLAAEAAPDGERGMTMGLAQSSGGLARTVGPLAGGTLFDLAGPGAPFACCAVAAALAFALGARFDDARRAGRESEAP